MDERYRTFLQAGQRAGSRYRLVVPRSVPQGITGARLGRGVASSLEFMDYRDYQPGDDLRRLDWSAYARSDKLTIKLFREEVNPHVDIILDGSRSMALGEGSKAHAGLIVAALLSEAGANAGFTHCSWLTGSQCSPIANGTERAEVWDGINFASRTNPGESLEYISQSWRSRGVRVFISDLLWPAEPLSTLQRLTDRASVMIVIQILAEADMNPPRRGNVRLVDSETDRIKEMFIDATSEKRYRQRMTRHQQNWYRTCRQVGAQMITLEAERVRENPHSEELISSEILQVT